MHNYDLAIIGGGINGVGIAADAAGRGLRVALFEQADLAGATSSASTKLVHGGLRYLETYQFALVRKALKESQLLLELAPHLIEPISIILPYERKLRPWWMLRAGLFIYNHLASRPSYPPAAALRIPSDSPLHESVIRGISFADGQVDDARLVILNACQARNFGADIFTYHRCVNLEVGKDCWNLRACNLASGSERQFTARAVVNASGPWVSRFVREATGAAPKRQVRMVRGSHILVPSTYEGTQAYMLQNADGRIAFVIPYQGQFTMIGTTEAEFDGNPTGVEISEQEIDYLLDIHNRYFVRRIARQDIVYSWSGVRPLIDDRHITATRTSRDYQLVFEEFSLPLLSVYGGKLTTYRLLAEQAVDKLSDSFAGMPASNTARVKLPGGEFGSREELTKDLTRQYPWLPKVIVSRWVTAYGSLAFKLLSDCDGVSALGKNFGHGLTQREVDYLVAREWARSADDILWRRTKLGLLFDSAQRDELETYIAKLQVAIDP